MYNLIQNTSDRHRTSFPQETAYINTCTFWPFFPTFFNVCTVNVTLPIIWVCLRQHMLPSHASWRHAFKEKGLFYFRIFRCPLVWHVYKTENTFASESDQLEDSRNRTIRAWRLKEQKYKGLKTKFPPKTCLFYSLEQPWTSPKN